MKIPILLFEDEYVHRLWPIALARPAFAITCGAVHLGRFLHSRVSSQATIAALVREYLRPSVGVEFPWLAPTPSTFDEPWLLVNARCAPTELLWTRLVQMERASSPVALVDGDQVIAARLSGGAQLPATSGQRLAGWIRSTIHADSVQDENVHWMLRYPHDVLRLHPGLLAEQLQHRISQSGIREIRESVFAQGTVTVRDPIAFDTSRGPIVLEQDSRLEPFAFLRGPLWVGPSARINPHAAIYGATAIGADCRVGGEIAESILEPFSNKQHDGFLGHAYVGSWVNLGAGTTNSDLKNTYGTIRVQCGEDRVDTGLQFLGCVIGDYAKTAIQTRILTGKLVGMGSMIYGTVSGNIPDFVNFVSAECEMTAVNLQTATTIQARMFSRRGIEQRDHHRQLLAHVFALTAAGRAGLASIPPSL